MKSADIMVPKPDRGLRLFHGAALALILAMFSPSLDGIRELSYQDQRDSAICSNHAAWGTHSTVRSADFDHAITNQGNRTEFIHPSAQASSASPLAAIPGFSPEPLSSDSRRHRPFSSRAPPAS